MYDAQRSFIQPQRQNEITLVSGKRTKLDTVILSKTNSYFVFFLTWILDFTCMQKITYVDRA